MQLLANELPANSLLAALLLTVVAAAWTDFQQWRIPNRLLVPSAVAALILSTYAPGAQGLYLSLLGAAVGLLIFLPLYALKGMAAGDVKLMSVIGLYAGPQLTLDIALVSALIGGLWVVIYLIVRCRLKTITTRLASVCVIEHFADQIAQKNLFLKTKVY